LQLIVGLGNPGVEYESTRHNVGYRVLDELARRLGTRFRRETRQYAQAEVESDGEHLVLLKPLTYMNRSGQALRAWSARTGHRVTGQQAQEEGLVPIVVCDDLALPLGSLRIRSRGSAGGQKGLASLIEVLGGQEFPRLRLGIAGGDGVIPPEQWSDYVLEPFTSAEAEAVAELIVLATDALQLLLREGPAAAAARCNRRIKSSAGLTDGDLTPED
jgi:PTH1 family peptidyl-tRNA hydrolase